MSDSTIEKFLQRSPKPEPGPLLVVDHDDEYEAFDAKDRAKTGRLHLRCVGAPCHSVTYQHLIDIVSDEEHYCYFSLVFNTMIVTIKGRNLKPVLEAIALGNCNFLQEFNPRRFALPSIEAPFIEHIDVLSGTDKLDLLNLHKTPPPSSRA